ncbi:hypothetical protein HY345_01995 [Candidatus Microgenomates bacterium]|nr:hypothetical protein [Candidatus Microgenomates bacterium]
MASIKEASRRKPWLTIILILLAIVTFLSISDIGNRIRSQVDIGGSLTSSTGVPSINMGIKPQAQNGESNSLDMAKTNQILPPDYDSNVPVTDTREFLKTDYRATMQTRDVPKLVRRAETTIRGFGGRIDQTSSTEKYGLVDFVVPKSNFSEFRDEIESFVGQRFLKVEISSQNLLPQKQNIEEMQKEAEQTLADLNTRREKIIADHNANVQSLQSRIRANENEQASLRAEVTTDPERQTQITNRLNTLARQLANLKSQLANENSAYTNNLNSIDSQIKNANDNLTGIKNQDQNLLDNVETVNGTIVFSWISLWEIVQLYLPGYLIPSIFAFLAVVAYWWERHHSFFKK